MKNKASEILKHIFDKGFDFDATIKEVDELRLGYRQQGDVEKANTSWALMAILRIHRDFRKVHTMLLEKQFYEAWCLLETIEIAVGNLLRNFPGTLNAVKYISMMVWQLQSLYPYKVFMSTEILIKKRTCSICGKKRTIRHHCGHFPGYVYNGEMCYDTVEVAALEGLALVFDPEHKYAVAFLSDGNGRKDQYNYMLLEEVMKYWRDPFMAWHYTTKQIHKSPEEFPGLTDDSMCPCGSGKKYEECCKNDPEGVKHVVYMFGAGWGK